MIDTFKSQVRQIFKDAISCKNCPYRNKDGYCTRINDLFHVELRVDEKSECILSENFKIINKDEGGI